MDSRVMKFYSEGQLKLQEMNKSEAIANQLRDTRLHTSFTDDDRSVINSSMYFFLATSGDDGSLDCSYKGGCIGFVRVLNNDLLAFANYDGNGMYRSLGNILERPQVALLFIQFEGDKRRIRVNGTAEISLDPAYLKMFPEAESVILVRPGFIFPNCPRNIHTMVLKDRSIYSPTPGVKPPEPYWKSKTDLKGYVKSKHEVNKLDSIRNDALFSSSASQNLLNSYYRSVMGSPERFFDYPDSLDELTSIRSIEDGWMEWEDSAIKNEILPSNKTEFFDWYKKKLRELNDNISVFLKYLEEDASPEAIAYYVCMEELVDGSFDDIMALAQLGVHNQSKLAIAENYWDEMGNGEFSLIHTEMFANSSKYCRWLLEQASLGLPKEIPTECLMNGNLVTFWALRRRYIPRLFGAIGLIEGSAPLRFRAVTRGMERCGYPESAIAYHREHITIDAHHGKEWLSRVLLPLIENNETACQEVAKGVLIRFRVAEQYYRCTESIVRSRC